MLTASKRVPRRVYVAPDVEAMLDTAWIKRCGICQFKFEASQVTMEDGIEKCPNCIDHRTEQWKAETEAREVAYAATREPMPQISQKALGIPMPAIVRNMTDANGTRISQSAPLSLTRSVAKTLILNGRGFSAADSITGSDGLSIGVTGRTSAQTVLSVTAAPSMTPGNYHFRFNNSDWLNVFSVR